MDNEEREIETTDGRDTGRLFVSKIGMLGCIMFMIMLVGFLLVCFLSGNKSPIKDYEPLQTSEYYAENPQELAEEINNSIIPRMDSIIECYCEDNKVVVVAEEADYFDVRSALLDHFSEDLFDFRKDTADE